MKIFQEFLHIFEQDQLALTQLILHTVFEQVLHAYVRRHFHIPDYQLERLNKVFEVDFGNRLTLFQQVGPALPWVEIGIGLKIIEEAFTVVQAIPALLFFVLQVDPVQKEEALLLRHVIISWTKAHQREDILVFDNHIIQVLLWYVWNIEALHSIRAPLVLLFDLVDLMRAQSIVLIDDYLVSTVVNFAFDQLEHLVYSLWPLAASCSLQLDNFHSNVPILHHFDLKYKQIIRNENDNL